MKRVCASLDLTPINTVSRDEKLQVEEEDIVRAVMRGGVRGQVDKLVCRIENQHLPPSHPRCSRALEKRLGLHADPEGAGRTKVDLDEDVHPHGGEVVVIGHVKRMHVRFGDLSSFTR